MTSLEPQVHRSKREHHKREANPDISAGAFTHQGPRRTRLRQSQPARNCRRDERPRNSRCSTHCWKTGCKPWSPHCSGKGADRSFPISTGQTSRFYRLHPAAALWPRVESRDRGGRDHHSTLALPRQKRDLTEDFAPAIFGGHRRPKSLVVQERETAGAIPQPTGPPGRLRRSRCEGQF